MSDDEHPGLVAARRVAAEGNGKYTPAIRPDGFQQKMAERAGRYEERYAQAALTGEAEKVATAYEGTRNDTLNTAALKVGRYMVAGHLDADEARDTLAAAARKAGLPDSEIAATINSGFNGARKYGPRDIPPPRDDRDDSEAGGADTEPTTWEPVDLGPYLRGEITQPKPSVGIARSDGLRLIYPGREHAILGETESGKTWLALGCVAAELMAGHHVAYIHYEESDPGSTIERLLLLGVEPAVITARLQFVGPSRAVRNEWITPLLDPPPTLVVHDGVNEAMSLIGADIMAADGAATFRRRLITPFLRAGAATIACDHLPMVRDASRRDAYGSVHKGNALDGARFVLENTAPFGRRMRGVSYVFATKDWPGHLRTHGHTTKTPGKTFMGTLIVDDSETVGPDFTLKFFAPKDDDEQPAGLTVSAADLGDAMYEVIAALPDHTAGSSRKLYAAMRAAGHKFRNAAYQSTVDDLICGGRVVETQGRNRSTAYRAIADECVPSASREESE